MEGTNPFGLALRLCDPSLLQGHELARTDNDVIEEPDPEKVSSLREPPRLVAL